MRNISALQRSQRTASLFGRGFGGLSLLLGRGGVGCASDIRAIIRDTDRRVLAGLRWLVSVSDAPAPITLVERGVRALRIGGLSAYRGAIEFSQSENLTFAASIAYYSLLSFFPFVVLLGTLFATIGGVGPQEGLISLIENSMPSQFQFLTVAVRDLNRTPAPFSVVGVLVTAWASMGVFGALTSAVNHAWGVENPLGFWRHKLVAFVMMTCAFLLLVIAILLISATRFFEMGTLTPTFILVVGLIYYFAPNTRVRLRDVWFGAVLAGLLWRGAFAGFAWYLRAFSRLSLFGTVGTVMAFLVWVYVSAVILLYGVEVTAAYARLQTREEKKEQDQLATGN
jgi:membrane protein